MKKPALGELGTEHIVEITVNNRELTLIRVACFAALDELRFKMRADHITRENLQALSKSYDETHTLLKGKLWDARLKMKERT